MTPLPTTINVSRENYIHFLLLLSFYGWMVGGLTGQ